MRTPHTVFQTIRPFTKVRLLIVLLITLFIVGVNETWVVNKQSP